MDVRPEIRADERAVDELHRAAFGGEDEPAMVRELRQGDTYLPDLSLVAVQGGTVVGHLMLTIVALVPDDETKSEIAVLSLAPLGVVPAVQGQGVGSRLVDVAMRRASKRIEPFVVVLGHPAYYPRFGFSLASAQGIRCGLGDVPDEAYLVRRLPGYRPTGPGVIQYRYPAA
ncbi:MAG: N-acetyltransferase [Actinomycetota bacterium]|nr:N-acetyltransferase [Actinomycetota bacterium]